MKLITVVLIMLISTTASAGELLWGVSTDSVSVLTGGENGVTDKANPNDAPVTICPRSNASCMYLSTTSGWWNAATSDGSAETTWSPVSEDLLWDNQWETGSESNLADYDTNCLSIQNATELTLVIGCTDESAKLQFSQDVFITKFVLIARDSNGSNPSHVTTAGCTGKLVTGLDGATDVTNGEFDDRSSSANLNNGDIHKHTVGTLITAGSNIMIKTRDGDYCASGTTPTTCDCTGTTYYHLELWGVRR
tara:strand:+ start:1395 stop:2144 length:750 start_codon:yes stop_codon:yes gene_type:complete